MLHAVKCRGDSNLVEKAKDRHWEKNLYRNHGIKILWKKEDAIKKILEGENNFRISKAYDQVNRLAPIFATLTNNTHGNPKNS